MIEVLFDESECSAMKMALYVSNNPNVSQVICMPFMLSIGNIKTSIESETRKKMIFNMSCRNGVVENDTLESLGASWKRTLRDIQRLRDYADQGETIRIWYSDAPDSVCGFHHVCSILRTTKAKVFAIKLPPVVQLESNELQVLTTWGGIRAEDFFSFTAFEKELQSREIEYFASVWDRLQTENSRLRALVNGRLISVPEDFYDGLMRNEIPTGAFMMSHMIEKIMTNQSLGIGDVWIATRIQKMIENGELNIVQNDKDKYRQVLKKAEKMGR